MCAGRQNGQDISEAGRRRTQVAAVAGTDLDQTASLGGFYKLRADWVMIGSSLKKSSSTRHSRDDALEPVGGPMPLALPSKEAEFSLPEALMTSNAAIEMLTAEHQLILKVVDSLRRLAGSFRAGGEVDVALLREAVAFMRKFADECHHAKEEDLLFPAFVAHGVPLHGCPIDALLHEHQQGRQFVRELASATEDSVAGSPDARNAIADAIDGIVRLYPNHIWKEDEMVFPMAERLLPAEARAELYAQFQGVEAKNPPDAHEHFHRFAEHFDTVTQDRSE
jgi:hemerythrin-like domain-containing protein